ncbi:MAG: phage tail protein [Pseudomonadales bacterium]
MPNRFGKIFFKPTRSVGILGLFASLLLAGCVTTEVESPANRVVRAGDAGGAVILGQLTPIGTVIAYAGSLADDSRQALASQGWLACDGSAVERARYAELYSVLGNVHGAGDGRLTFNLPDYRGLFLRGVSAATRRDPDADARSAAATGGNTGNQVGSIQGDTIGLHQHADVGTLVEQDSMNKVIGSVEPRPGMVQTQRAARSSDTEHRESRPKNAYVHYLVFGGIQTPLQANP